MNRQDFLKTLAEAGQMLMAHQFFIQLLTQSTAQAQAALYRGSLSGKPRAHLRR